MKATAAAKAIPSLSDFLLNLKLKKPISKELASIENTYLRSIDAIPSEIFFYFRCQIIFSFWLSKVRLQFKQLSSKTSGSFFQK